MGRTPKVPHTEGVRLNSKPGLTAFGEALNLRVPSIAPKSGNRERQLKAIREAGQRNGRLTRAFAEFDQIQRDADRDMLPEAEDLFMAGMEDMGSK